MRMTLTGGLTAESLKLGVAPAAVPLLLDHIDQRVGDLRRPADDVEEGTRQLHHRPPAGCRLGRVASVSLSRR